MRTLLGDAVLLLGKQRALEGEQNFEPWAGMATCQR
jgi:hypothetical protein